MAMTAWAEQKHINIEARKEIGKLKKRITELEANQPKRDLEQQAKGVSDFYNDYFHIKFTSAILIRVKNDLQARFKELRKKAQELNR